MSTWTLIENKALAMFPFSNNRITVIDAVSNSKMFIDLSSRVIIS